MTVCEQCNGTGWASVITVGVERVTRCACWLARQQTWAPGTPREFQSATLDNYRPVPGNATAVRAAKQFVMGDRDLVLIGPVGAGKTRLACSVLNTLYAAQQFGWFQRVPLMLHQLQPGANDAEAVRETRDLERRLMTEPVLVLDDLGAERERATDYTRRTLLMVYEARHDAGLRTIWTTNKTIDDLAAMQDDDRLASRLAGWADIVELTCADQRLERVG